MSTALILAILIVLVGVVLMAIGLHGRRINDHPVCRSCRFNLVGVYPAVGTCPECGGDLAPDRAVRRGARQRRRGALIAGSVCLLVGVGLGGAMAWGSAAGFNWNTVKPVWMLMRESESGSPANIAAAVAELADRLDDDKLTETTTRRLIDRALAEQASDNEWVPEWGEVLRLAELSGLLTPSEVERMYKLGIVIELEMRSRVAAGEPWPISVKAYSGRASTHQSFTVFCSLIEMTIDGKPAMPADADLRFGLGAPGGGTISSLQTAMIPAEPGERLVKTHWRVRVTRAFSDKQPLAEWTFRDARTVQVLEPGRSLIELVNSSAPVRQSIQKLSIEAGGERGGSVTLTPSITFIDPPTDMAFAIEMMVDGERIGLSPVAQRGGNGHYSFTLGPTVVTGFEVDTVTLVFRPSPEAAGQVPGIDTIWGGEDIVFDDVPVEWVDEVP